MANGIIPRTKTGRRVAMNIKIDKALRDRLKEMADSECRTVSNLLELLAVKWLERHERSHELASLDGPKQ